MSRPPARSCGAAPIEQSAHRRPQLRLHRSLRLTSPTVGRPNVGSSLFNRLLEQDRAIVTDIPGRLAIWYRKSLPFAEFPCGWWIPPAFARRGSGWNARHRTQSPGHGGRRSDAGRDRPVGAGGSAGSGPFERAKSQGRSLIVGNKSDLPVQAEVSGAVAVSALTGAGIDNLREAIFEAVAPGATGEQETGFITSLRHERLLRESLAYLEKARPRRRRACRTRCCCWICTPRCAPIDAITGATTADDILNRIFSTFCIGK